MNRYDEFLSNDYSFQQHTPIEFAPDLRMMDELMSGVQTEYDEGMSQLNRIMPNYLRESESDTQAAMQFRDKYDNLISQTTQAFTDGDFSTGRRQLRESLREVERDQLPGGDYYELERRTKEFDEQDKALQATYLDPKSPQYFPEAYNFYREQLANVSQFKENDKYGSISRPDTTKMYTDDEELNLMTTAVSKLPADQYARGPEFAAKLAGMTVGDVMSQGLVKHLDPNRIMPMLQAIVGEDMIQSKEEKQRIRGQELTEFMANGQFNPNDPLGAKAKQVMDAFSYSQESMTHQFIPSNLGGEGSSGRTRSGKQVDSTNTPNVQIVQDGVVLEVKPDNLLDEEGNELEADQGLQIYNNTARLFRDKTKSLPDTLATTFRNNQLSEEVLKNTFFKYMPDTQEEFGTIQDADYYPIASEVFSDQSKYNELLAGIQAGNPELNRSQAKMQADKIIRQADFLYMGINEDVAYYKKAQERYKEKYVAELDPISQELIDWNPQETPITETKYFQETVVESLTNPAILGRGDIFRAIDLAAKNNAITPEQATKAREDVTKYRDKAAKKTKLDDSEITLIRKDVEDRLEQQYGPAILESGLRNRNRPEGYVVESLVASEIAKRQKERASTAVGRDITQDEVIQTVASFNALDKKKYETSQLAKYDNESIHSQVSEELMPDMKRSMPVLNYLSQGFDHSSETNYEKLYPIQKLQVDARGLEANVNNQGELVASSGLVTSSNMFKVSPEGMYEQDGFSFELTKKNKMTEPDKANIVGVKPIGFVKAPDNKIYYYGQTQVSEGTGEKVEAGDYVYYEMSEADNLTEKFYDSLGLQDNVYEDLHFFNKQLDMAKLNNPQSSVDTYVDQNYLGMPTEIRRNKKTDGSYGYKLIIGGNTMFNGAIVDDSTLALGLYSLKRAKYSEHRGDRNNNPGAFTVAVARQAGLREGIDFADEGDTFTSDSGKTYTTARLLGNPVDLTIKVIDNIGFKKDDGGPRWGYIGPDVMTDEKWNTLTPQEKITFVQWMETREGGSLLQN